MKAENEEKEAEDKEDGRKKRSAARSSVSFTSEKETTEPQPLHLLSLGDVRMDRSCSNKQTQTS